MKKLLAYGLSFLMALTCLTGCGGGSEADLRVAVGKDTADLDPAIVDDSVTANILAQVYQGLYTLDTDGNVITNLATDMPEISEDGLTYTIKISGDTKWSDGEKVKAYLRKGAKQLAGYERWPNALLGYGALCVRDSLPGLGSS